MQQADEMPPPMALALEASFGGVQAWREAYESLRRNGPVCLCFVPREGRLVHRAEAHEEEPVLFDSRERPQPDWNAVYQRYQDAVHAASEGFGVAAASLGDALLFDVRRAAVYAQAEACIPGAAWRDPARVGEWGGTLPRDRPVVVYCVHGHEVGRSTALRLRALGVNARFLEGGIEEGWRAQGRPLAAKTRAS